MKKGVAYTWLSLWPKFWWPMQMRSLSSISFLYGFRFLVLKWAEKCYLVYANELKKLDSTQKRFFFFFSSPESSSFAVSSFEISFCFLFGLKLLYSVVLLFFNWFDFIVDRQVVSKTTLHLIVLIAKIEVAHLHAICVNSNQIFALSPSLVIIKRQSLFYITHKLSKQNSFPLHFISCVTCKACWTGYKI